MKFLFFIFISFQASILRDKNIQKNHPKESKKTLLDFDNKEQNIHIFSPNTLNKISTRDKKSSDVQLLKEDPSAVEIDTKSHMFQDYEQSKNQNLDTEKNSIPDKIEGITEEQKVFSDLLSEITDGTHIAHGQTKVNCHDPNQHCSKKQKLTLAQDNLEEIKKELKKALVSSNGKKPVVVNGNLLQTMMSYLNHLDYINQVENDYLKNPVPKMPEPLIIKHVVDESNQEQAIDLQMVEKKKELEQKLTLIEAKMQDLKNQSDEQDEQELLKIEEQKTQIIEEIEDIDNQAFTGQQKNQIVSQIQREYTMEQQKEAKGKAQAAKDLQNEISQLEAQAFKLEQQKKIEDKIVELDEEEQNLEKQKEDLQEEQQGQEKIDNYQLLDIVKEKIAEVEKKKSKLESQDEQLTQKIDQDDINSDYTHQGASLQKEHDQQSLEQQDDENEQKVGTEQQQTDQTDQLENEDNDLNSVQDQQQIQEQPAQSQQTIHEQQIQYDSDSDHTLYYVEGQYKIDSLGETKGEDIKFDQYGNPKNFNYKKYLNDNFKDLVRIKAAVDSLTNGFIQLFANLPFKEDDIPEDFELNRKKTLMIFNTTYRFIYTLQDNKGEFYKDMKFLLEKLYNFEVTKERITEYYSLEDRYDDIIEEVDKSSPDYIEADKIFSNLAERFTSSKNAYQADMQKILKMFDLLLKETQFLQNFFFSKQEILFQNKVQVVEDLYPKMLSIKNQSIKIMSDIKNQLDDFKIYKLDLIKILEQMDIAAMKQGEFYKKLNDVLETYQCQH